MYKSTFILLLSFEIVKFFRFAKLNIDFFSLNLEFYKYIHTYIYIYILYSLNEFNEIRL